MYIGEVRRTFEGCRFSPVSSTSHSHVSIVVRSLSPSTHYIFILFFFVLRCPSVVSVTSIRFVIGICVVLVIAVVVITVESR